MHDAEPEPNAQTVALLTRLAAAERALAARDKTIRALVNREKDRTAKRSTTFGAMEENAALQQVVAAKTAELEAQKLKSEQSEARFSSAFEHAPIGVALVSPGGRWLKVNPLLCAIVGYSEAELLTLTFQDITCIEDLELNLENRQSLLSGRGRSYQMEKRYVHKDGHFIPVLLDVSLVRDDSGDPLYFICQVQDITARKRAAVELEQRVEERTRELANSLSVLHATLESTADGILAIRLSGEVLCYNSQFVRMWGVPAEVLNTRDGSEFRRFLSTVVADPERYLGRIAEMVDSTEIEAFDVLGLKDGRSFERYVKAQQVEGRVVGVVINFRDITERLEGEHRMADLNRQLLQSSRQAGMAEVASSVLHNVGNVLNSVNVSLGVASNRAGKLKSASLVRIVALLREHGENLPEFFASHPQGLQLPAFLAQLAEHFAAEQQTLLAELGSLQSNFEHINEIVAMQQSHAGTGGLVETLSLADVIDDALRMNSAALVRHGVRVVCEVDATLPSIEADRHKILLILVNLIRNAKYACSDAGHPDKTVTVRASRNGDGRAKIVVSDNGIGISTETLPRIFEHGFTTRKDGHGFGLHSSALAAADLGGALRVQSDGPGRGATFTIELPLTFPTV